MRAKSQGKFASNLQPLMVWWLGFLIFIQATQVQFLGRKLRSRFTPPLTAALLRSVCDIEVTQRGLLKVHTPRSSLSLPDQISGERGDGFSGGSSPSV